MEEKVEGSIEDEGRGVHLRKKEEPFLRLPGHPS